MPDFDGDFDLLPFSANARCGDVPLYPIEGEWQIASMGTLREAPRSWAEASTVWFREAVRERRLRPACAFDSETLKAIARRVADELFKRIQQEDA